MKYIVLPLALALFLSACSLRHIDAPTDHAQTLGKDTSDAPLLRDAEAPFQTDRLSYTLVSTPRGIEGNIAYVLTNRTQAPLHIVNCNGSTALSLEKQIGDQWVKAWSAIVPACLSQPIIVQPAQEYRDVVHVFGGHPGTMFDPKFSVDPVPGVYRLVWRDVLESFAPDARPFGEPIPLNQRTSNRFRLDVE